MGELPLADTELGFLDPILAVERGQKNLEESLNGFIQFSQVVHTARLWRSLFACLSPPWSCLSSESPLLPSRGPDHCAKPLTPARKRQRLTPRPTARVLLDAKGSARSDAKAESARSAAPTEAARPSSGGFLISPGASTIREKWDDVADTQKHKRAVLAKRLKELP